MKGTHYTDNRSTHNVVIRAWQLSAKSQLSIIHQNTRWDHEWGDTCMSCTCIPHFHTFFLATASLIHPHNNYTYCFKTEAINFCMHSLSITWYLAHLAQLKVIENNGTRVWYKSTSIWCSYIIRCRLSVKLKEIGIQNFSIRERNALIWKELGDIR